METLERNTNMISDRITANAIINAVKGLYDRTSCQTLGAATLAISAASSPLAKISAACLAAVQGKMIQIAAGNLPALVGSINANAANPWYTSGAWNVYSWFIDKYGNITTLMGYEAGTVGGVIFPKIPEKQAWIGFVLLNTQGSQTFVGGTTALDSATVLTTANT